VSAAAVYAAGAWALGGAPWSQWAGNASLIAAAAIVVLAIWRRRRSWAGAQRLFWDVFALGSALWIIGHLGWLAESALFGRQTWLRWHTVFSLCGSVAPLIALLAAPHRGARTRTVPAIGVDLAVFGLLAVFIYCYFVLVPSLDPASGAQAQSMLLVLIQAHRGLLLAALVAAIALARDSGWRRTYVQLAAGVAIGFVLRFGLSAAIARGEYVPGTVHDLAWIVPMLCYAWAAHEAPASRRAEDEAEFPRPAGVGVSAVPVILLPTIGYGVAALAPLGWPIDAFRALLTSVATVGGFALLAIRLTIQRAALQRTDARLRLLAAATEQTADLILILRADGTVEHANHAFLRALGYTRRELSESGERRLLDEDLPALAPAVTAAVRAHGTWRGVVHRRRRDGSAFPSACSVSALRQGGVLTHYVAVERDISEEIRLRDQLVHSERLSAIGELVAGVAHEINNPLQTIVGTVELMMDERPGAVNRRDLELVRHEAARAGQIVRNLLSFVRRGSGERQAADLNQIVRSMVELREYHLRLENIQVRVAYAPGPLTALASRDEIQQVVLNLLLNAEQAVMSTNRPGVISVTTRTDGSSHVIEVADSGPGIGPDLRGRIFEPFFTTKEVGEGTGLGLSISHGIAAAHGGALELVPCEAGACFRLTLPALRETRTAAAGADPLATDRRAALVVDDEESIRRLLARLLTRRGFEVHEAATGEDAIERAASHAYGLVLCDMKMPGMDGLELHRRLLSIDGRLGPRFVFITGDTSTIDAVRTAAPDAAVLGKPFTAADLDAVLATLR
jgi:PAS domain S-box-containing protein